MRKRMWQGRIRALPTVAVLVAGQLAGAVPGGAAIETPDRLVAVGDVHGEYDGLVSILQEAALIDDQNLWIGVETTLVQTGDLVDRGLE